MKEGFGADFSYQSRMTTVGGLKGRLELGGLIADFLIPSTRLVIQTLSEYYHYRKDLWSVQHERQNAAYLAGMGYYTVYIDSDALDRDPVYYVREAMAFRDHSKMTAGMV